MDLVVPNTDFPLAEYYLDLVIFHLAKDSCLAHGCVSVSVVILCAMTGECEDAKHLHLASFGTFPKGLSCFWTCRGFCWGLSLSLFGSSAFANFATLIDPHSLQSFLHVTSVSKTVFWTVNYSEVCLFIPTHKAFYTSNEIS